MNGNGGTLMGLYSGRLLWVDLSTRQIDSRSLDPELARTFIGSRGLNSWLLYRHMAPGADPLGPDNVLVFGTGPLAGTAFPASGRFTVSARSPLTGILGDANSGGLFGAELKAAGWDHIVITGRADSPVILWIQDTKVELRDGSDLWGLDTWETTGALQRQAGDSRLRVACIGPAGEHLVRYAAIINEQNRAAGRTGMGAVMGSKQLKAIAVRGSGRIALANKEAFGELVRQVNDRIHKDRGFEVRSKYGTASLMALLASQGVDATRNHQSGYFEGHEAIGAEALATEYWDKQLGCYACPIRCSHSYAVSDGPYAGTAGEGPEYETLNALGSKLGNDHLPSILHANTLANRYGLDTMSLGTTIAFAMECYEKGLIEPSSPDDPDLRWGNHAAIVQLIHRIAHRQGIGDLLAEGSKRAAELIGQGASCYAMHSKGMELPAHDPRGSLAAALSYAVSSRGADHLRAGFVKVEKKWKPADAHRLVGDASAVDPLNPSGKAALVRWEEDLSAVSDSVGVCIFTCSSLLAVTMADFAEALSHGTGLSVREEDLWQTGGRITTLERAFNLRNGLQVADDTLPTRFFHEQLPSGPSAGIVVTGFEQMVGDYYALRGWNASGVPLPATLVRLGLPNLVPDLWPAEA